MHDLIYLSLPWLAEYDNQLKSPNYIHHKWFNLKNAEHWPIHTTSRVHQLDTPWSLAPTVCPIPDITNNETRFDIVLEQIAEEFCQHINSSGKTPYICWSGGIDSTSILVSILKIASLDFLKKVTILYSSRSIRENPYFYYKYIDKKLNIQDIDTFQVNSSNYNKIVIVDGEAGNQIMGQTAIHKLIYKGRLDLLTQPWADLKDLTQLLIGANKFNIELVLESIHSAPVPIKTGYDFLWWTNFNFKFDDVLLRKSMSYTEYLTPAESKFFWENGLSRFYAHPAMQIWSMITKDLRCESSKIIPKHIPKKYIFDYDHNDYYYSNKFEEASGSQLFFKKDVGSYNSSIFAIDSSWNKYSVADKSTRVQIGQILQRI